MKIVIIDVVCCGCGWTLSLSHHIHTSQCGNSGDEEDEEEEEGPATATFFLRRFFLCCFAAEGFSHSRDVFVLVSVLPMLIAFLPRRRFDLAFVFFACASLAADAVRFLATTECVRFRFL